MTIPPPVGLALQRLANASPLQGAPAHALHVPPVGGMFDTPILTSSCDTSDSSDFDCSVSTDSQGQSTVATCSLGKVPFITALGPLLTTLEREPMDSWYVPSAGLFLGAQCTRCATPHMHGPRSASVPDILVRDLLPSCSAARSEPSLGRAKERTVTTNSDFDAKTACCITLSVPDQALTYDL